MDLDSVLPFGFLFECDVSELSWEKGAWDDPRENSWTLIVQSQSVRSKQSWRLRWFVWCAGLWSRLLHELAKTLQEMLHYSPWRHDEELNCKRRYLIPHIVMESGVQQLAMSCSRTTWNQSSRLPACWMLQIREVSSAGVSPLPSIMLIDTGMHRSGFNRRMSRRRSGNAWERNQAILPVRSSLI